MKNERKFWNFKFDENDVVVGGEEEVGGKMSIENGTRLLPTHFVFYKDSELEMKLREVMILNGYRVVIDIFHTLKPEILDDRMTNRIVVYEKIGFL